MKLILCLIFLVGSVQTIAESEVLKMMRISCNTSKSARACYNYANLLYKRQEYEDAKVYFKKGCKKGYAPSCKQETTDRYINAVITKRKTKNKRSKFEQMALNELKKDKALVAIINKYCEKDSKAACFIKKCQLEGSGDQDCMQDPKNINTGFKRVGIEMKKMMDEIPIPKQEEFKKKQDLIISIKKSCTENNESPCSEASKLEMSLMQEKMEIISEIAKKTLAKECDNGRIDSCFSIEYEEHMMNKVNAL